MTSPTITLPAHVLRSLHSGLVDWLAADDLPPVVRDAMVARCQGLTFDHFTLALLSNRLVVTQRTDEDSGHLLLGVAVPAQTKVVPLIELADPQTGVSADDVVGLNTYDLDAELVALLGGAAGGEQQ